MNIDGRGCRGVDLHPLVTVEARGLRRRIIGSTTHFAGTAGLTLSEPPLLFPLFTVSMACCSLCPWPGLLSARTTPAQQWLRGFVRECLA